MDAIATTKDDKTWGMLCHLAAYAGLVIPFGNFIGPLVVWLLKKEGSAYVDAQGKESLNFQISLLIYGVVGGVLTAVLVGFAILAAVGLMYLILVLIATVKANSGEGYRYPLTIRLLK